MSPRLVASLAAIIATLVIVVVVLTTPLPRWLAGVVFVLVAVREVHLRRQTKKLAVVVHEALRAKGPMTVTQAVQALDPPRSRLQVIAALGYLRVRGSVTRALIEPGTPDISPKDSHRYTAA